MKKSEMQALRQYVGDLDALCGIKDYTFNDGPARGMRAFDLDNGKGIARTVLADRGLDIPLPAFQGRERGFRRQSGPARAASVR